VWPALFHSIPLVHLAKTAYPPSFLSLTHIFLTLHSDNSRALAKLSPVDVCLGRIEDNNVNYSVKPVGYVQSDLKKRKNAPRQGYLGAPEATIEILPRYANCLHLVEAGQDVIVITFLHKAKRSVMKVHPGRDMKNPLTGVFATRSPDRPNPLGLHRVKIIERDGLRLRVGPLEAIDGTPVVDMKLVLAKSADS
jgi:tRNA-Thr(GGU) m(6)t(6)A37 methyltransferase TsaA